MRRGTFAFLTCALALATSTALSARQPSRVLWEGDCTSTSQFGGGVGIDCIGNCPEHTPPLTCDRRITEYSGGVYESCACTGMSPNSCCHIIVITPTGEDPYFGTRGNCPDCSTTGSCHLDILGTQAICGPL